MFIDICGEKFPSSVGAASATRRCRSYGAKTYICNPFYKHRAPTERKTGKTSVDTNGWHLVPPFAEEPDE
jgi:hypothetical protein